MNNKSFKAGKYYIGDLCYIIDSKKWSFICTNFRKEGPIDKEVADIAMASTTYGDGLYNDNKRGTNKGIYYVDSGTIGVISMDNPLFDKKKLEKVKYGKVVDFENDFKFECTDGKFVIGDIKINTS